MIHNATITAWRQRTGVDEYGRSTFADGALPPGGLRCTAEPHVRRLVRGGAEVVTSMRLHVPPSPAAAIAAGDELTIGSITLTVIESAPTLHRTLGHATFLCA